MTDEAEFRIQPIDEADIDAVVVAAGGARAHPDAARRTQPGVDYLLGETLIELKILEEDGLAKPERQAKLSALFRDYKPERPVVILDRADLPVEAQRRYDHIVEGPIKTAVTKARRQIAQSQSEIPRATCSILLVLNNGYTALDHETLLRLVARRARNDSTDIDGVLVGGCYFHSDGFDSFFLWPLDYVPIHPERAFREFDRLREAWNAHAERTMTALMQIGALTKEHTKGPVIDTSFDLDGVTFVKPAPPFGEASDFYLQGRPRKNTSGLKLCPPVGLTIPVLSLADWLRFKQAFPSDVGFGSDYATWLGEQVRAERASSPLQPLVPIVATFDSWQIWCKARRDEHPSDTLRRYANSLFEVRVRKLLEQARERMPSAILPHRYVLAVTEIIGQDEANDVSHIASIRERPDGTQAIRPLVELARISHPYALALAAAYALAEDVESVLWQKDLRYAWQ
jgi:hypothetical protein